MNKKTGELSAADLKKPIGRKDPRQSETWMGTAPRIAGQFVCMKCSRDKPDSELSEKRGHVGGPICKACDADAASMANGTYRSPAGATIKAMKHAQKEHAKKYKSGRRLPKWMFT